MRYRVASLSMCALASLSVPPATASECHHHETALGVSRVLHVDTTDGPLFGTLQYEQTLDLEPKEVVLTFDDGPHPYTTGRVLEALRKECVKATFFPVGNMAEQYSQVLQEVSADGHTIGAHTWSHRNMRRLSKARATQQIERGFRAVDEAADIQIAPFFRFPGLKDSKAMIAHAARQNYAVFSTDVTSDDWRGIGPRTIIRRTMTRLRRQNGGIVLFHDTKRATATALPGLLKALKKDGYRIVHIVPHQTYDALRDVPTTGVPEAATVADLKDPSHTGTDDARAPIKR